MKKTWRDYIKFNKPVIAYFMHWEGRIEKVKIIDCDFNKYVTFLYEDGTEEHYKWGYVFETYDLAIKALDAYNYLQTDAEDAWEYWSSKCPDCINPYKLLMSKKDYAMFSKLYRKEKHNKTQWYVAVDDESYYTSTKFNTLRKALNYFGKLDEKTVDYACLGEQNTNMKLLTFEDNNLWVEEGYDYKLKSSHLGKDDTYKQWRK